MISNAVLIFFAIFSHTHGFQLKDLGKVGQVLNSAFETVKDRVEGICPMIDGDDCPEKISYFLYTRSTQDNPTQLDGNGLDQAPWGDGPLKFIVHGYSVNHENADNAVLRPAYFGAGEYNIVSVDWSPLGKQGCYVQAMNNVPKIGKCVANMFNSVARAHQFNGMHLLGHSMGAHIAAAASNDIPDLPRLTKFDVANPLFNNDNRGSAQFIDVYHSNSGLKGQPKPSGDVDVYFNNNVFQPGCKCDTGCSHLRAVEFYAESIGASMKAFSCGGDHQNCLDASYNRPNPEDLVMVGDGADTSALRDRKGAYMVFTTAQKPFLQGDNIYTDEATFNSIKDNINNECAIHEKIEDYKDFVQDWLNL